ncbi:hypothetical protein Mal52_41630 [Symmachiella dynata]|uniref:Uncharacterized protein n=1 Tax=Symmachiella dynata TaxID=2527995 RepID=A0A517ZT54_9PLAN|nr:hypothetical protein Mal52_41630 [Symmachiella dynata]
MIQSAANNDDSLSLWERAGVRVFAQPLSCNTVSPLGLSIVLHRKVRHDAPDGVKKRRRIGGLACGELLQVVARITVCLIFFNVRQPIQGD